MDWIIFHNRLSHAQSFAADASYILSCSFKTSCLNHSVFEFEELASCPITCCYCLRLVDFLCSADSTEMTIWGGKIGLICQNPYWPEDCCWDHWYFENWLSCRLVSLDGVLTAEFIGHRTAWTNFHGMSEAFCFTGVCQLLWSCLCTKPAFLVTFSGFLCLELMLSQCFFGHCFRTSKIMAAVVLAWRLIPTK